MDYVPESRPHDIQIMYEIFPAPDAPDHQDNMDLYIILLIYFCTEHDLNSVILDVMYVILDVIV